MNGIWRQVLVGSAVVMLLLALAALEILGEPGRADQPTARVSSPSGQTSTWEDLLITQDDLLNFELGLTPSSQASDTTRLVEREGH